MSPPLDLTGQKFGRLTALEPVESAYRAGSDGSRLWLCRCECGRKREVTGARLRRGATKSCGCLRAEKVVEFRKRRARDFERARELVFGLYRPRTAPLRGSKP